MTLALRYAVRSDVGLLREGNEDSAYAGPHLLAVADGMGGHAAGEVASSATIVTLSALDNDRLEGDDVSRIDNDLVKALAGAVANANMRLQEMIISDPAVEGMGTTVTALLWVGGHAALSHIGDSRAYLLRAGELYQITHDHTLVQSLVDEGRLSEDDVPTHPQRSLLLRALDGRTLADPDLSTHETVAGDRYLLCSDGLSGVVTEQTIQHVLNTVREPDQATMQLIDLAIRGGGPDNITCIVADVIDTDVSGPPPTVPIMAGAASNGAQSETRSAARLNSPAGRARRLAQTAPQRALPDDDDDERWNGNHNGNGRHGHRAGRQKNGRSVKNGYDRGGYDDDEDTETRSGRRRWPIVTTALVLLVVVVFGGGYVAWRYTQGQYYVGEDTATGQVAIFRGVNQDIAGISLSSLYQRTGIKLAQVPRDQVATIQATIPSSNLSDAQRTVTTIKDDVASCQNQYATLATWETKYKTYMAQVNIAKTDKKAKVTAPDPGQEPGPANVDCAPSTAFGIGTASLPGTQQVTVPVTTSPAPKPSSTPKNKKSR
jgi:PPM family protein phosphatase